MGQTHAWIRHRKLDPIQITGGSNIANPPIKDAATLILVRDRETAPKVLMGQRGAQAAFMPNKFVFPGGAVDRGDARVALAAGLGEPCHSRLLEGAHGPVSPDAMAAAAIRELWEEAGLIIGQPGQWPDAPADWKTFAATGHLPAAKGLHFVFRAITPPGRPRRFDARFFIADASQICGDPDDFSQATDELSHLQWVALEDTRNFNLPFITEVVLAEIAAALPEIAPPQAVPFFDNTDETSLFARLGGQPPAPITGL